MPKAYWHYFNQCLILAPTLIIRPKKCHQSPLYPPLTFAVTPGHSPRLLVIVNWPDILVGCLVDGWYWLVIKTTGPDCRGGGVVDRTGTWKGKRLSRRQNAHIFSYQVLVG